MPRPLKQGLDYFPFDTDFFDHPKIQSLQLRYGNNGVMIYLYIICEAYRRKGYYLKIDTDVMDNLMRHVTRKEGTIKQVLEFLCARSLLTQVSIPGSSDTFVTSPRIQESYQDVAKGLRRDVYVNPHLWILEKDKTAGFIKFTLFEDKSRINEDKSSKNEDKYSKNATNEIKSNDIDKIDMIRYSARVKKNIEYDLLKQTIPCDVLDELVSIIVDVITSSSQTIRIGGMEKPYELVRDKFCGLNCDHIQYVYECMSKNTTKVRNIHAYLVTALFNAPDTIEHYYRSEVNYDTYCGGFKNGE